MAKSFLFFGGEDWWYHNRAHIDMQLIRRFAKIGTAVYVNSIIMRKPEITGGKGFTERLIRKGKSILRGMKESGEGFWVYSPFTMPVHHISWARPINEAVLRYQIKRIMKKLSLNTPVVWVACPSACDTAVKMKKERLIYQRTDRYEDDPHVDRDVILEYDRKLKKQADVTVYVNKTMYEQEKDECRKAFFLDHGVDYEMFANAEQDKDVPVEMADVKRPIIGYFGRVADHKLDVEFIHKIAALLPDCTFVFVGYATQECREIFTKDNIKIISQQPYQRIPHYGKCFDVAILPWRVNKWTEAANPIKLKEYLALGKPVVCTPSFTELSGYLDVVYEAAKPEDFAACIRKAMSENTPGFVKKRREKIASASWDSKAELMLNQLYSKN